MGHRGPVCGREEGVEEAAESLRQCGKNPVASAGSRFSGTLAAVTSLAGRQAKALRSGHLEDSVRVIARPSL